MWSIIAASVVDLPEPVVPVHEHEAALRVGDLLEHRRQHQLPDAEDPRRDDTQNEPDGAALLEDVAAEAPEARHGVADVDLHLLLETLLLARVHDRERHRRGVVLHQAPDLDQRTATVR